MTLTFDLWPCKSIGFQTLLRTKYVPSLVKIYWRILTLECSQGCHGRTDGSVTMSLRNFVGEGIKRTNDDLQNITQKTEDWATQTQENGGELLWSERVSSSYYTNVIPLKHTKFINKSKVQSYKVCLWMAQQSPIQLCVSFILYKNPYM